MAVFGLGNCFGARALLVLKQLHNNLSYIKIWKRLVTADT